MDYGTIHLPPKPPTNSTSKSNKKKPRNRSTSQAPLEIVTHTDTHPSYPSSSITPPNLAHFQTPSPPPPSHLPTHSPLARTSAVAPTIASIHSCGQTLTSLMGSATHFALTFLDAFVTAAFFPELPALAATLTTSPKNVPLVVSLLAAGLFLGRAGGALWWHYRHPASHPSAKGDLAASLRAVLVATLIYSIVYFLIGFINKISILFLGQLVVGWVMGGHAVKIRAAPIAILLGIMVGPLLGGLYDAQHTLDPCPPGEGNVCTRWASGAPMAPVGVAVLGLAAFTGILTILLGHREPVGGSGGGEGGMDGGRGDDVAAYYRRLDAGGGAAAGGSGRVAADVPPTTMVTASAASINQLEEGGRGLSQHLMAAIHDAEIASAAHHSHLHILVIPPRYVKGCNGDMDEAARRWKETLAWRAEARVDSILSEPQPNFKLIKECYPHFLHRRDKEGHPIYYELLGKINLKKLKANGVTVQEMVRYYIFETEYIWTKLQPEDDEKGSMISILDVEHVGIMDLRGDALEFLKAASKIVQQHYVERSYKMYILNAPSWFSVLWKVVAPMLHENTRKKISILGKDHRPVLEVIDAECLPRRYGGVDVCDLGEAPEEVNFREYTEEVNRGGGGGRGREYQAPTVVPSVSVSVPGGRIGGGGGGGGAGEVQQQQEQQQGEGEQLPPDAQTHTQSQAPPLTTRLLTLTNRLAGGIKILKPAFLTPLSAAHQANLGKENRFVYDETRQQWVLIEEEEGEGGVDVERGRGGKGTDETEERLIKAIQAAHEEGGRGGSISGRLAALMSGFGSLSGMGGGGGGSNGNSNSNSNNNSSSNLAARNVDVEGGGGGGAGGGDEGGRPLRGEGGEEGEEGDGAHALTYSPVIRSPSTMTYAGSILLLTMVAWRALSLSLLLVLPLWLADHQGAPPFEIALLLFCGAVLATGLWAINTYSQMLSSYVACVLTLLVMSISLVLVGPLTTGGETSEGYKQAAGDSVCVIIAGCALLMMGCSVTWAIHISKSLFKKEAHVARYDLTPSLAFADVVGAVCGPVIYYKSTIYGGDVSPNVKRDWPMGPATWFSVCALLGLMSVVVVGGWARPLLAAAGGQGVNGGSGDGGGGGRGGSGRFR